MQPVVSSSLFEVPRSHSSSWPLIPSPQTLTTLRVDLDASNGKISEKCDYLAIKLRLTILRSVSRLVQSQCFNIYLLNCIILYNFTSKKRGIVGSPWIRLDVLSTTPVYGRSLPLGVMGCSL